MVTQCFLNINSYKMIIVFVLRTYRSFWTIVQHLRIDMIMEGNLALFSYLIPTFLNVPYTGHRYSLKDIYCTVTLDPFVKKSNDAKHCSIFQFPPSMVIL